jgi:hypothetical protein
LPLKTVLEESVRSRPESFLVAEGWVEGLLTGLAAFAETDLLLVAIGEG